MAQSVSTSSSGVSYQQPVRQQVSGEVRDSEGISELPQIQMILPYKIREKDLSELRNTLSHHPLHAVKQLHTCLNQQTAQCLMRSV